MNEYVLITGASSGIGYELAKVFASHGYQLILVARNEDRLSRIKKELEIKYKIQVYILVEDLCDEKAPKHLYEQVRKRGIEVDILINNAGAGYTGKFHEETYEKDLKIMQLNMVSLTELTKLFVQDMVKNQKGKILNVASTGAYHPGPYTAIYYATKSYVLSLSEALAVELSPYHVTVSALCPGATRTNFAKAAGREDTAIAMDPAIVARIAYKKLMKNKTTIVPGIRNKLFIKLPRQLASRFIAKYQMNLQRHKK